MTLGLTAANDVQPRDPAKQFLHLIVTLGEYWASISQWERQARQQEMTIIIIASGWGFSVRLTVFLTSTVKILHSTALLLLALSTGRTQFQTMSKGIHWPSSWKYYCSKTNAIWYCFYVESKKWIQMSLFVKQKWTHIHGKQIFGYLRGGKREIRSLRLTYTHYCIHNR